MLCSNARECVCRKIVNLNSKNLFVVSFRVSIGSHSKGRNYGIRCSGHFSHMQMAFEKNIKKIRKIKHSKSVGSSENEDRLEHSEFQVYEIKSKK